MSKVLLGVDRIVFKTVIDFFIIIIISGGWWVLVLRGDVELVV